MASVNNLRVVADNVAERATVTASTTAGVLAAANLLTSEKGDVWRATGTSARLSLTWSAAETFQAVALPFCNLSPTATMRVRTTNEQPATNLVPSSEDLTHSSWQGYWNAPAKTTGIASPDGGTRATRLASTDSSGSTNNSESGMVAAASAPVTGRITASIWARSTSGTLAVVFGINDTEQATYQLTTSWQRLVYTSTAALTLKANDKLLQIHEATLSNPAWDVFGAQVEVGTVATSYYPTTGAPATRTLGYIDAWQSYTFDSGQVRACPAPAAVPRGWPAAKAASAYAYGGGAYARYWLPAAQTAEAKAIDIVDTNNLQGYIEAACLVVGPYWSPKRNASEASMTPADTTALYRTDAGSQGSDAGYVYRKLSMSLGLMRAEDRTAFVNILRYSRAYPIMVSLWPESTDLALERDNLVYGRRSEDSTVALDYAITYASTITIEEI